MPLSKTASTICIDLFRMWRRGRNAQLCLRCPCANSSNTSNRGYLGFRLKVLRRGKKRMVHSPFVFMPFHAVFHINIRAQVSSFVDLLRRSVCQFMHAVSCLETCLSLTSYEDHYSIVPNSSSERTRPPQIYLA